MRASSSSAGSKEVCDALLRGRKTGGRNTHSSEGPGTGEGSGVTDDVSGLTTEANYARWHARLEERTQTASVGYRAVLISVLLGPDDGPHSDRWVLRED